MVKQNSLQVQVKFYSSFALMQSIIQTSGIHIFFFLVCYSTDKYPIHTIKLWRLNEEILSCSYSVYYLQTKILLAVDVYNGGHGQVCHFCIYFVFVSKAILSNLAPIISVFVTVSPKEEHLKVLKHPMYRSLISNKGHSKRDISLSALDVIYFLQLHCIAHWLIIWQELKTITCGRQLQGQVILLVFGFNLLYKYKFSWGFYFCKWTQIAKLKTHNNNLCNRFV